jgi:signal peptidase I
MPTYRKLLNHGRQLCQLAQKVVNYRKDVLSEDALTELLSAKATLETAIQGRAPQADLEAACKQLDPLMRQHGGDVYPVTMPREYTEMIIVAAIVAIAIRTFFFQPFKIPTNSMYPTYAGMLPTTYCIAEGQSRPAAPVRALRFVTQMATNYRAEAPVTGRVVLPLRIQNTDVGPQVSAFSQPVPGKSFGVVPTTRRAYQLGVLPEAAAARGEGTLEQTSVVVPLEFTLEAVLLESYFPGHDSLVEAIEAYRKKGQVRSVSLPGGHQEVLVITDVSVEAGEPIIDFDISSGDMLFVDRMSYHFVRPQIGQPVVFRTDNIPGLREAADSPSEQYYIKRLVGMGGDRLKIQDGTLLRDAAGDSVGFSPIQGSAAFKANAHREGEYEGYQARWRLAGGQVDSVAEGYAYTLGDNSDQSFDSRGWGFDNLGNVVERRTLAEIQEGAIVNQVPVRDLVGKAVFIFYPLTGRWGPAQ